MRRYLSSYLLDSFRARVTPEDFAEEQIRRVRVVGEADFLVPVARRLFPGAEMVEGEADAVVIAMTGGPAGPRLHALLSRARHKLLVPSPDYIYRFGNRGAWPRAVLALLALPLSFVMLLVLWSSTLGLARRLR